MNAFDGVIRFKILLVHAQNLVVFTSMYFEKAVIETTTVQLRTVLMSLIQI